MSTLTGKACAAKHRHPCASKNGHEGVVKFLGLRKDASPAWFSAREVFLFPQPP